MTPLALPSVSCEFKVNSLEPRQLEPRATDAVSRKTTMTRTVEAHCWGICFAYTFWHWFWGRALHFFLICRRARRQRSQSPILVTVRIDKHFGLYKRLEPKRKINEFPISLSSDGVDEQIPFDSPISKKESGNFTIQQLKRPSPMVVGISK